jgi:signal transduction histidine kinase/ligand-binding sensor domain-containing protein/DNA-binding response OmpR family regulator
MKKNIVFIFIVFLCIAFRLNAQNDIFKIENLSTKQGLSQSTVLKIMQDRQGFMWFLSQDGMNKYDGYSITPITSPLSSNIDFGGITYRIIEDIDESIWITSELGLCKYDRRKNTWIDYSNSKNVGRNKIPPQCYSIFLDSDQTLWVGSRVLLFRYNRTTDDFTKYPLINKDISEMTRHHIVSITEDKNKNLWIATNEFGLFKFDKTTGKNINYKSDVKNPNSLSSDYLYSACFDNENKLWISGSGGLDRFDIENNKFTHYKINSFTREEEASNGFAQIYNDKHGRLWIPAMDGLKIIDNLNKGPVPAPPSISKAIDFKKNKVLSIFEDRTGIIWIGTSTDGIYKCVPERNVFSNITVGIRNAKDSFYIMPWGITEGEKNILWIPSEMHGLIKYDRIKNNCKNYLFTVNKNTINNFIIILKDKLNDLWIASDAAGLCHLELKKWKFSVYGHNPSDPFSISSNIMSAIYEDKKGNIWLATSIGLNKFDREKMIFIKYFQDSSIINSNTLNILYSICEDNNHNLWIGTGNGFTKFDMEKEKFTNFINDSSRHQDYPRGKIYAVHYSNNGILWAGGGYGLTRYDISKDKATQYTEKDGLPNNSIYSILEDKNGNLWMSTLRGISNFDIKNNFFINYDVSDGLQGNEFNQFSGAQSPDGEMFFGGTNGITCFYPDRIKNNDNIPPVVITSFRKFDKPVEFDRDINNIKEIVLNHDENYFSFEFSALNFLNTEKNQYAYKMEGFDKDWIKCGTRRYASYTNLDPGEYIFKVKGSNNDGLWNEEGTSIKIIIKPPYWMTWWFRTTGVILFLCIGFTAYRAKVRSIKNRSIYLEKQVNERTKELSELNQIMAGQNEELKTLNENLFDKNKFIEKQNEELIILKKDLEIKADQAERANRSKSEFLANMSHEIRTPMNAILGFAEILSNKARDAEFKNYTSIILSSGNALLTIINDILDLSKIEAGKLELQPTYVDLGKILQEIKQLFTQKVTEKGLELFTEINEDFPKGVFLDEVRIRQIIMNITGNAIKFTEKGYIKISISGNHEMKPIPAFNQTPQSPENISIAITIEDTGIGIPTEQIEKIFKPFEQAEGQSTKKFGGTGLGLSISTRLIKMMGGDISVQSEVGKGSKFKITLPELSLINETNENSERQKSAEMEIEFRHSRILVVDDVLPNRELVKAYLEGYGLEITEAQSGEETLEETSKTIYDLILLDRKMPGIGGEETAICLKKNEKTKDIPIIIFTASALKEEEERLRTLCNSYLTKPINKMNLIKELKKYLPYDEKIQEKKIINEPAKCEDRVLNEKEKEELKKILIEVHKKEWENISKARAISGVKNFAINLQNTAEKFGYITLVKYSEELLESANLFKIAKVKTLVNEFPEIINRLN